MNNTDADKVIEAWPTSFTGNAVVKKELEFELFNLGSSPVYEIKIELIFHDHRIYFPIVGMNHFGYYYPKDGEMDVK